MTPDRDPELGAWEIVGAYINRFGWSKTVSGDDLDDLWGRLLLTCVHALSTWDPGAGRNRVSWCWLKLHRDAGRWWAKHLEWRGMSREPVEWEKGWWAPGRFQHEDGYNQVEDRAVLQQLVDRCEFTGMQVDALRWWAVHVGTETRHLGGHGRWFPEVNPSWRPSMVGALKKLRAAADEKAAEMAQLAMLDGCRAVV